MHQIGKNQIICTYFFNDTSFLKISQEEMEIKKPKRLKFEPQNPLFIELNRYIKIYNIFGSEKKKLILS